MSRITVYTTEYCPYCDMAKRFLNAQGLTFEEIDVTDEDEKAKLKARTGWRTVPQIFINDELIGGYQEMMTLHAMGELSKKLNPQ